MSIASVTGREYPPVEFAIEPEHVAAFAHAIDADPEAGVPPTYAAVYALFTTARQLFGDAEAAVDFGRLVHAEQEFKWDRHPEPGETITARGKVAADIERRGARFITFETTCTAADDSPLASSRALFVVRP
ncbi:MAG TPA: MaoC family dehydratase N-terminal domain-containing protein [Candidatus Dormibacteraeota bacterium]